MLDLPIQALLPVLLVGLHLALRDPFTLLLFFAGCGFAVWDAQQPRLEEPARTKRIRELGAKSGSLLHMRAHRWYVEITASGDGSYDEIFEGVKALKEPVPFIEGVLKTDTGYLLDPVYKKVIPSAQGIRWEWTDRSGKEWKSKTVFNPPICCDREILYHRTRKTLNVVFFNQRDRDDSVELEAERNKPESLGHRLRHIVDHLFLEIHFPEGRFPTSYWPEALAGGSVDLAETSRIRHEPLYNTRGLTLTVDEPYPGYTYRLVWELPTGEEEDKSIEFGATVIAAQIRDKFASLPAGDQAMQQALDVLATAIRKSYGPIPDLSMVIFAYRRQDVKGGLHPVAQYNRNLPPDARIPLGRGLVGQCYRRNADVLFSRFRGGEYYEEIPGEAGLDKPAVAVCIPLNCPEPRGLRVGVLMIDTRTAGTGLDQIFENDQEKVRFGRGLRQWYIKNMSKALGVKEPLRAPAEPQIGMLEAGGTHGESH